VYFIGLGSLVINNQRNKHYKMAQNTCVLTRTAVRTRTFTLKLIKWMSLNGRYFASCRCLPYGAVHKLLECVRRNVYCQNNSLLTSTNK